VFLIIINEIVNLVGIFFFCNIVLSLWYQASLGAPDTSVEFQRVNSRICVAMMVFAPIYVAQMMSSYLRDPENKTGAFGWVKS